MRTRGGIIGGGPAGMLEQGTVDALHEAGAADRLDAEGLTGGRTVTIHAQTELVKDLIALHLADGPPLLFEAEALAVEKPESDSPVVRFRHEPRRLPGRHRPLVRPRPPVRLARHPHRSPAVLRGVDLGPARTRLRPARHAPTRLPPPPFQGSRFAPYWIARLPPLPPSAHRNRPRRPVS